MSEQLSSVPPRRPSPRQVETVDRLLVAAATELRSTGPEALTMRGVAARAGVSPATAYTYFASRNHLVAQLFWSALTAVEAPRPPGGSASARLLAEVRAMVEMLVAQPELASAVTTSLLSSDPDVERLRLLIGADFLTRFRRALGDPVDDVLLESLVLAFSGALLQAGMGLTTYAEMGERLDAVLPTILRGNL